jgi:hypothetical protein
MCCSLDRLFETLYAYRENPDDPSAQLDALFGQAAPKRGTVAEDMERSAGC